MRKVNYHKWFSVLAVLSVFTLGALQTWQMVYEGALEIFDQPANTQIVNVIGAFEKQVQEPLRLYASSPADAILNIDPSSHVMENGTSTALSPASGDFDSYAGATLNYQTGAITGGSVLLEGAAFSLPACTVGQFRRHVWVYDVVNNAMDTKFSSEVVSEGSLENPATTMSTLTGVPIGYVDLECTNVSGLYKTPGSSTDIIENSVSSSPKIVQFKHSNDRLDAAPLTNPMDSTGDLITGTTGGAPSKLDSGADNTVLQNVGANTPAWALIDDANVDAGAAIAGTKISPDFGSQNVQTTGDLDIGATGAEKAFISASTLNDGLTVTGNAAPKIEIDGSRSNVSEDVGLYQFSNSGTVVAEIEGTLGAGGTHTTSGQMNFRTQDSGGGLVTHAKLNRVGDFELKVKDDGCSVGTLCTGSQTSAGMSCAVVAGTDSCSVSFTSSSVHWKRNGNMMTVMFGGSIDPNTTSSNIRFSGLPEVSANFTQETDVVGSCWAVGSNNVYTGRASADVSAQTVIMSFRDTNLETVDMSMRCLFEVRLR